MPKANKIPKKHTLALVLSGGAGRRFHDLDKGLQSYRGKPLIQWVISQVQPQVHDMLICINRNKSQYIEFGVPLVFDNDPGYPGPLAGVTAAIDFILSRTEYKPVQRLLLSSCDSPALPGNYVAKLHANLDIHGAGVAVVHDGNRTQNLHCLIDRSKWESLRKFYRDGGRAIHRWHKQQGAIEVDFSDQAECFLNINSPEQLS
ncbi:MAG: molybdenum cofactor guanylyltransferase MobA [Pseudomonadota bacterium]